MNEFPHPCDQCGKPTSIPTMYSDRPSPIFCSNDCFIVFGRKRTMWSDMSPTNQAQKQLELFEQSFWEMMKDIEDSEKGVGGNDKLKMNMLLAIQSAKQCISVLAKAPRSECKGCDLLRQEVSEKNSMFLDVIKRINEVTEPFTEDDY